MFDDQPYPDNLPATRDELSRIDMNRRAALAMVEECIKAIDHARATYGELQNYMAAASNGTTSPLVNWRDSRDYKALQIDAIQDRAGTIETYRKQLDANIWAYLMKRANLSQLMDATAMKDMEKDLLTEVTEATPENIMATFEHLMANRDLMFKRGIARAFARLDRRFKSHDAFRLHSRVILTHMFNEWGHMTYSTRVWDMFRDVERAFALINGDTPDGDGLMQLIRKERDHGDAHQSEHESRYFRIKCYKKGTAHLWFRSENLVRKVNAVLADYYGEVLPDAVEPEQEPGQGTSRAVSKDLQFYPTPPEAAAQLVNGLRDRFHHFKEGERVLEPSAGHGALIQAAGGKGLQFDAVEVNEAHIDVLRQLAQSSADPIRVISGNFLEMEPTPIYDHVLMNPPFYGTHWMKHVRHAYDFLKPGGHLSAILPVTAAVSDSPQHERFRAWAEKNKGGWSYRRIFEDLPEESFASSGTNINTVILRLVK